jgi:uncharacterized protein (DUF169 family)
MCPSNIDLSIFNKFGFQIQPIGMKFLFSKPEGVERLNKNLAFCEMFKEAQEAKTPFYADFDNHICGGGPGTLGQGGVRPLITSAIHAGMLGPKLKIFKDTVANRRTLLSVPKLEKDTVNYVLFSPLNIISFVPDILLITAKPRQAEIILRSYSYTSGAVWEPRITSIVGCAWLTAYPYLSGKLNYTMTGLGFGMIARELWPEGLMLLSIPYDLLPAITQNLSDMKWELENYKIGRDAHDALELKYFNELLEEVSSVKPNENTVKD